MSTSLSTMSMTTSDIVALHKNVGNNSYGTSTIRRLRHRFQSSSTASLSSSTFSSPNSPSTSTTKSRVRHRSRTVGRTKKRSEFFGDEDDESEEVFDSSFVSDEQEFGSDDQEFGNGADRQRRSSKLSRFGSLRSFRSPTRSENDEDDDDDDIVLDSQAGSASDNDSESGLDDADSSKHPHGEARSSFVSPGLRRNASSGNLRLRSHEENEREQQQGLHKSDPHHHLRSASSGKFRRLASNATKSARERLHVPSSKSSSSKSAAFFSQRRRRRSATLPKAFARTAEEPLVGVGGDRKVSVVSPRFEYYDKGLEQAKVRPGSDHVIGIPRGANYHDIEKQVSVLLVFGCVCVLVCLCSGQGGLIFTEPSEANTNVYIEI